MQVIAMKIRIEGKVYGLERGEGADVRIAWPDGTSTLHRGIECREDCYSLARQIAHAAYGTQTYRMARDVKAARPACTNSMVYEITDAVERVAGC